MYAHFILYVEDQQKSKCFYSQVLELEPTLDVPGMTEFALNNSCIFGLMPISGIVGLIGEKLPNPGRAAGIPRSELYLRVKDAAAFHMRALLHGAIELSSMQPRDWGHSVAYCLDQDGHVLAFAEEEH